MRDKKYEINEEIKFRGNLLRIVMPKASRGYFRFARKILNLLYKGKKPKKYAYEQLYLGKDGNIRTCVYARKDRKTDKAPVVLWLHGGGYGLGIPEMELSFIKEFLIVSDCVVVAPDYTLSYVKPYPQALNECYEVLLWINDNAQKLGIDRDKIIVAGDSAGGGLTLALCLYARDEGKVKIAMQIPIYPMIDDRKTKTNADNFAPLWDTVSNDRAWKIYLQEKYRSEDLSYYAAPARCEDLSNMPPTISYIGDIDLFLSETETIMKKLKEVGVYVDYRVFKGCYHGFDNVALNSQVSLEARAFLREQFAKFLNGEIKNG